jgi:hypothetical protein
VHWLEIGKVGAIGHFNPRHQVLVWVGKFADHQAIRGSGDLVVIRVTRITGEFLA